MSESIGPTIVRVASSVPCPPRPSSEPRPWLLALTGYAGSGKDTVASMLQALDPNVRTVAFADAVRELTGQLYGLPGDREWWQAHKGDAWGSTMTVGRHGGPPFPVGVLTPNNRATATGTLRDLLIHVGTTCLRSMDPEFWLRMALKRIDECRSAGHPVVVTDLRFANEAQALFNVGAHIRLLSRPGCEPKGEADLAIDTWWAADTHPATWAITYENDGTLDDLADWAARLHAGLTGSTGDGG